MRKRIWWIALLCFVMISVIGVQMSWAEAPQTFRGQKSKATKVSFRDMEIEVPAGADEATMTIENGDADLTGISKPRNFVMIGKPYRFGPHGKRFNKSNEIIARLPYDAPGVRLYYINREKKQLEKVVGQRVNQQTQKLEAKLHHFSDYVLGISYGWDDLTPFSSFIQNGEEKVETKNLVYTISSSIITLPGRGGKTFDLRRSWRAGSSYSNNPFSIGATWNIAATPYWFNGNIYLPSGECYDVISACENGIVSGISIRGDGSEDNYDEYINVYFKDGSELYCDLYSNYQIVTYPNGDWLRYNYGIINDRDNEAYWHRVASITTSWGINIGIGYNTPRWYAEYPEMTGIIQFLPDGALSIQ